MFTIKVVRISNDGTEKVCVYEARSVDVLRNTGGIEQGEAFVVFRAPSNDEQCVTVTNKYVEDCIGSPARQVIIENAAGKTTEIVRAFN